MKKIILCLLALIMAFGLLAGCTTEPEAPTENINKSDCEFDFNFEPVDVTVGIVDWDEETIPADGAAMELESYTLQQGNEISNSQDPVRYVMIYNPDVYQEGAYFNSSLSTGNIASQVEVNMDKGGMSFVPDSLTVSQGEMLDLPVTERQEMNRGLGFDPMYSQGDTRDFYCADEYDLNGSRISREFTCRYAGTYCNVWVADVNLSDSIVASYGEEFDAYIYESVVSTFGTPRFTENGGKINLLYYPMPDYIGGFFSTWDLFSSYEVSVMEIMQYGLNTDHAIVHINGYYADYDQYPQLKTYMFSTMAHEFQHLICATATFENPNLILCDTWINEAMSGYIEENLYEGVKENSSGHLSAFHESDLIRGGQSLYNFDSTNDDIGVYGSVYLYSSYVANLAGQDVFHNFNTYWRNAMEPDLNVSRALVNAVPAPVYQAVDTGITFPATVTFASPEDAWMSKLTLYFYLDMLHQEAGDPAAFGQVMPQSLLYNEINPANIEGGGRIIVALSGDRYVVPENADKGLIYVGLNEDFEVVTPLIYG